MGHVYVKAVFYNPPDYIEYLRGERRVEDIRKIETNALVETGATFPALPEDRVGELALPFMGEHEAEVAEGKGKLKLTYAVTQIEDRTAVSYVIIRPKGTTPLIGVVALEQMGYRIDPTTGKLIKGLPLML